MAEAAWSSSIQTGIGQNSANLSTICGPRRHLIARLENVDGSQNRFVIRAFRAGTRRDEGEAHGDSAGPSRDTPTDQSPSNMKANPSSPSHWDEQETLPMSGPIPSTPVRADEAAERSGLPASSALSEQDDAADRGTQSEQPPATRRRGGDSIFQSLLRLWPRDGQAPLEGTRAMADLRTAFRASLTDLMAQAQTCGDADAEQRLSSLMRHIVHARHPQDLWHLRTAVYTEVARTFDQGEAERRLETLNLALSRSRGRLRDLLPR